jgi:hypothetical protein
MKASIRTFFQVRVRIWVEKGYASPRRRPYGLEAELAFSPMRPTSVTFRRGGGLADETANDWMRFFLFKSWVGL